MFDSKNRNLINTIIAIVFIFVFFLLIQFSTERIVGNDGHFHIRFSEKMLHRGIVEKLPELRYTIWNDEYRDHHFLFHVINVPFALFNNIQFGAKLSAVFFATLAGIIFWFVLLRLKIIYPWFWIILFLAGSSGFLFRITMPRVQSIAVSFILLEILFLIERKNVALLILAFANVWLYDSFVFILAIGSFWLLSNKLVQNKWNSKPVLFLFGGMILGMLINPYFPENFQSYWFNISRSLAPLGSIPITTEWYSKDTWHLTVENVPIIVSAFGLMIYYFIEKKSVDIDDNRKTSKLFLFLTSMFFMLLVFRSQRFIEYAPPVVLLFLGMHTRNVKLNFQSLKSVVFILISIFALVFCVRNIISVYSSIRTSNLHKCYMNASKWISENIEPGETIFITDWDDFPRLYMNAPNVRYVSGLDPLFMQLKDKKLYDLYVELTLGKWEKPYSPVIRGEFDSRYVFSDAAHKDFLDKFDSEKGVYLMFDDEYCRIYKISP